MSVIGQGAKAPASHNMNANNHLSAALTEGQGSPIRGVVHPKSERGLKRTRSSDPLIRVLDEFPGFPSLPDFSLPEKTVTEDQPSEATENVSLRTPLQEISDQAAKRISDLIETNFTDAQKAALDSIKKRIRPFINYMTDNFNKESYLSFQQSAFKMIGYLTEADTTLQDETPGNIAHCEAKSVTETFNHHTDSPFLLLMNDKSKAECKKLSPLSDMTALIFIRKFVNNKADRLMLTLALLENLSDVAAQVTRETKNPSVSFKDQATQTETM